MNLLGKAMDKDFWAEVRTKDCFKKYREELDDLWKKHVENGPIMQLKYRDFKLFWTTGNRSVYERTYFTRRLALDSSCLLALIYPEEEKYLERLMDQIYAICDEYTWCLPAHQGPLEVNNNVKIDLFAAETGFALAEVYTMLEDRLEPLIKNRIIAEINRRIVAPITEKDYYGGWEHGRANWTAVCMGSVACTFMLMRPELAVNMIDRFNTSMEYYLSGFNDDGICLEGCGYWHYGFGFFTVYADMVRKFTEGKVDFFTRPKVKAVATFIQKMFLSGKASVSFADGGRSCSYHLGLCHYLKNEYPDDMVVYKPEYSYNYDGCGRFCLQLRSATWLNEDYYYNPSPDNVSGEYYAADSEWFIKRTNSYGFCAKGGYNQEPHNHNDVGSFAFAKNGEQMIMDVGAGSYTRQYFSSERYTMFPQADSRGHSLPIINGTVQFTGTDARAKDTKVENGVFSTDIAGAYKVEGLNSIKRSFSFTEDSVTLTDEFDYTGEGEIVDRLVSMHEIEKVAEGELKFKDATVYYDPDKYELVIEKEKCPFTEQYEKYATFKLKEGVKTFTVTMK